MCLRPAETCRRSARIYRGPGRIITRPHRMYGDTARFALTHDRMIASSAHYSRPAVHWLGSAGHLGLDSDDSSPCTARLLRPTDDLSLHTGHVDHSTARSTTAPAQSKHSHG